MSDTSEGFIPSWKANLDYDDAKLGRWERFKAAHPVGTWVAGPVVGRDTYGVFIALDEFVGLLLIPYSAVDRPVAFPADYPQLGEGVRARVRRFCDDGALPPDGRRRIGQVALEQRSPRRG